MNGYNKIFSYIALLWVFFSFYSLMENLAFQGTNTEKVGTPISYLTVILGIAMLLPSIHFFIIHYNELTYKKFSLFLFILCGVLAISYSLNNKNNFSYLGLFHFFSAFSAFIVFYKMIINTYVSKNVLVFFLIFLTICLLPNYYKGLSLMYFVNEDNDMIASNSSYLFVLAIPFILLIEKKILKYIVLVIILGLIFFSTKRLASITAVVALVIDYIYQNKIKSRYLLVFLFKIVIFPTIVLFLIYSGLEHFFPALLNRLSYLNDDQGSGRVSIYLNVIFLLSKSTLGELLFGHGGYEALQNSAGSLGYSAHNDFLEVFYGYGLLVFISYLYIHWILIKRAIFYIRNNYYFAPPFVASYIIFLLLSLFSHILPYGYLMGLTIFWSYISALEYFSNQIEYANENSCFDIETNR